jgi:predicted DNA-binding transcriptional regulator YafY
VGELRTFRLDRVAALEVTDTPCTVAAPDVLPPPRYAPGPDDLEVVLDLTVAGRWLLDAVDVDEVTEREGGGAQARLRTDAPSWVARLVLTAGGDATVVAPASLREDVARLARAALARYDED